MWSKTTSLSQVILRSLPVSFPGHSQKLLIKLSLYALQILMVRWGEKVHISLVEVVQSATPPSFILELGYLCVQSNIVQSKSNLIVRRIH